MPLLSPLYICDDGILNFAVRNLFMLISYMNNTETIEGLQRIITQEPAVMLYFYTDHCQPCQSLRPKVEDLLHSEFDKFRLLYINGEEFPQTAAAFMVFSLPTMLVFLDGNEYIRESQYVSMVQLERAIRRPYELMFAS